MAIGHSGTGKSTSLNIIFGTDFISGKSIQDVTVEMSSKKSKSGTTVIDTVGFLPNLSNVGKMFILFFVRRLFPDYLIYPAGAGRIVDVISLNQLLSQGYIKGVIFPFSANVYYSVEETYRECGVQDSKEKAMKKAVCKEIIQEINGAIKASGWDAHVKSFDGNDFPKMDGSMRRVFLREFFVNEKYQKVSYEAHMNQVKTNPKELLRGLLIDAVGALEKFAKFDGKGNVIKLNECGYLKG
eukprot:TRINITY_DN5595_c0_g1_i2.p1 TRINITY_DN5595_c0_g1~~TRINITY_DN5595_c0_g1_i2.p1  ORF type:complete len:241 (-),score=67.30 TRINITY_DN5595_c0_g1_i2:45-767(-)